jgi:hypothetical protein
MSSYTDINITNVENVRRQIIQKESCNPSYATIGDIKGISTDYDNFPYNRWYRGKYNSVDPIVAEREAGWRIVNNDCYSISRPPCSIDDFYPDHCFQVPCSTVFPCYPKHRNKYSDRAALQVAINKSCIPQYR